MTEKEADDKFVCENNLFGCVERQRQVWVYKAFLAPEKIIMLCISLWRVFEAKIYSCSQVSQKNVLYALM